MTGTDNFNTDILIAGCGVSGLYCALHLPENKKITIITKSAAEESDSYLAQGGICVLKDDSDYNSFFEDTLRAGHYENNHESVDIMLRSSRDVIADLISYGTQFSKKNGKLEYTREGAHSQPRILFHKDETGKEITSSLLSEAKKRKNITLYENYTMVDIISHNNTCLGIVCKVGDNYIKINADYTIFATGGIGGLFEHSTNYPHLTGDAVAIAVEHNIRLKNIDYIQIHPTTLYQKGASRKFLISESVRGEGAVLVNSDGKRFTDELQPRDIVTKAIYDEMKKSGDDCVYLSLADIDENEVLSHFPNIYSHCLKEGIDITKEPIPVVPAQHYFMGGIDVDMNCRTSMKRLYAVGETACNGVHGKNRLASNSLLESMVFAKRAALHISDTYTPACRTPDFTIDREKYTNCADRYKNIVLSAIEREKNRNG